MVEVIWPTSVPTCQSESGRGVLPLRTFIQETLRRSRTSFYTLQVALYYLILIKPHVPSYDFTMEQPEDTPSCRALQCGRRMFLAALILASKYLQDRNYSARAWSKLSGLKVCDINTNEMAFLSAVRWKLHIAEGLFDRWQEIILRYTPSQPPPPAGSGAADLRWAQWRVIVERLDPSLDGVDVSKPAPLCSSQVRRASTWPIPPPSPATPTPYATATPTPLPAAFSTSQENTPTPASVQKLPRFLEPRLDMQPPTPTRLGPLPTPSLTPHSVLSSCASTPAASVFNAPHGARRPSMCSAMQAAQNLMNARMSDTWSCSRRPSLAPSMASTASIHSSPESMVSDVSSRLSRVSPSSSASSIASIASNQACTAMPVKLARLAALRCAGMSAKPLKRVSTEPEIIDVDAAYAIPEAVGSPDFATFHIHEVDVPGTPSPDGMGMGCLSRVDSARSYCSTESANSVDSVSSPLRSTTSSSPEDMRPSSVFADLVRQQKRQSARSSHHHHSHSHSRTRKRGRSSIDMSLQQNVRDLLVPETRAARHNAGPRSDVVMDDVSPSAVAAAAIAAAHANANATVAGATDVEAYLLAQSPSSAPCTEVRLPVKMMKDGRKRVCCAAEAGGSMESVGGGMGMWKGVL